MYWPDEDAGTPNDATESWYDIVPTSTVDFSQLGPMYVSQVPYLILLLKVGQGATDDEVDSESISHTMDDP